MVSYIVLLSGAWSQPLHDGELGLLHFRMKSSHLGVLDMLSSREHQIWWTLLSQVLESILDNDVRGTLWKPTTASTTLGEKIDFGRRERPTVVHRNTVPSSRIQLAEVHSAPNHLPYSMHLILYIFALWAFCDERFDILKFSCTPGFESTRIVKNETGIAFKHHLIRDVV